MVDKKQLKQVKKLCQKFFDDIQALFDGMEGDTYEAPTIDSAVLAQSYAEDAVDAEDDMLEEAKEITQ